MRKFEFKPSKYIDFLTGEYEVMKNRYKSTFADNGYEEIIEKNKKTTKTMFITVVALLLVLIAVSVSENLKNEELVKVLEREDIGGESYSLNTEITADFEDVETKDNIVINVKPKSPTNSEAEALVKAVQKRLPVEILGENISADDVIYNLVLPTTDNESGADITWKSSNESIITENGEVRLLGAEKGEIVILTAHIRLAEVYNTISIGLKIGAPPADYNYERDIKEEIQGLVKSINSGSDGSSISLPDETASGIKLDWNNPSGKTHVVEIAILCMVAFFVFKYRYKSLDKHILAAKKQMEHDFPEFIEKLSLLLGAGLVVSTAMDRIIDDYCANRRGKQKRHLYEELIIMRKRMEAGNTPLVVEFADVARRSGIREVMRFNSILSDNIGKGSKLADKLDAEREVLWDIRKKNVEKEGRIAETKLMFPMVLQLLVIIGITVFPAALEM